MTVRVAPWSASWTVLFAQEAARLETALARWLVGPVEHVGSTAVPGLAAKPVLDMLAPVDDHERARDALPVLAALGYRHEDHRPHEALWCYLQPGAEYDSRTHQLHLTRPGSALWRERLAFRDALRGDGALRAEYQELKRSLSASGADLVGYNRGKRELVERVLAGQGISLG